MSVNVSANLVDDATDNTLFNSIRNAIASKFKTVTKVSSAAVAWLGYKNNISVDTTCDISVDRVSKWMLFDWYETFNYNYISFASLSVLFVVSNDLFKKSRLIACAHKAFHMRCGNWFWKVETCSGLDHCGASFWAVV